MYLIQTLDFVNKWIPSYIGVAGGKVTPRTLFSTFCPPTAYMLPSFITGGKRKWVLCSSCGWLHSSGMEEKDLMYIKIWLQWFSAHRLKLETLTKQPMRSATIATLIIVHFHRTDTFHGLYLQVSDTCLPLPFRPKHAQQCQL